MKLAHMLIPLIVAVPLAGCGGTTVTHTPGSGGDSGSASSAAPESKAVLERSGFGGSENGYLWVTSTVRDVPVGQFATVSFNLYSADGTLLATQEQVEESVNPGAAITVGTQVTAPQGQPVTRIEPTLKVSNHQPVQTPKFSDVVLQVGPVTLGQDQFGSASAEAELVNPSDQQIPAARVGVICFDQQGTVIGGGSEFPSVIAANGKVKVSARLTVTGTPDHCEMTAQPSEF